MSALVTFRDFDPLFDLWTKPPWYDIRRGEHNKIGYVTKAGIVVYPMGCGLKKTHIEAVKRRDHKLISLPLGPEQEKVDSFFVDNRENADLFFQGINAIGVRQFSIFMYPIKLPILRPLNATEYDARWQHFVELLQPADIILTLDTRSILSKIIATADNGVWSHAASYMGNGHIVEAITAGVVERSVEVYHTGYHRLGLYRGASSGDVAAFIAAVRSQVGKPYNYKGVLKLGIKKLFKIRPRIHERLDHPSNPNFELISYSYHDCSPTDLAMRLQLIFVV